MKKKKTKTKEKARRIPVLVDDLEGYVVTTKQKLDITLTNSDGSRVYTWI